MTRAVSIQSGRVSGTRFCQITSPPTPSGCRFSWHGRSYSARTMPSPTRDEVPHEVELRLAARRKVDLVRVRDLDDAAADLELDERRRHAAEYRESVLEDPRPIPTDSLEPLDDFLVVETTDEESETRAGLILPASAETQCAAASSSRSGRRPRASRPGDKVLFLKEAGYDVRFARHCGRRCCAGTS